MKKFQVWLPLLFSIVMIAGMSIGYKLRENIPASRGLFQTTDRSAVQEAMDLIRQRYVDPVNTDSLAGDAIEAMLTHLDPHSVFIPSSHLQEINEDLQGNFEGIGVEFQIIDDTVNVISVLDGGPSEKAGLKIGDKFLQVNDSVVAGNGITSDKIKELLRGVEGSTVQTTLLRDGSKIKVSITRGLIPLYSVDASYMIDDSTGYIHLNKFSGTSFEEFMHAMEELQKKGMKSLIFDLRDNGGGILGEAVSISDEFLSDEKLIVYTDGAKQKKTQYFCRRPGLFEKGRLVLLVNEGTASASEVVAGALQDWDRATIVGRRTFGKGLVQEQYQLSNGGALRLTVARYYTPTGRSIQKSYSAGRDAYNEEVMDRFHNGQVIHPDTTIHGKAFKTKSGRMVYGGDGISPDIFVPYDTTGFSVDLSPMFYSQSFAKFIYYYYMSRRDFFNGFKDPADFAKRYTQTGEAFKSLLAYLDKNHINIPPLPEKDKSEIERRIKSWLARQIWRMEGYYQVSNEYDQTVQRALEEIKK